MNIRKIITRTGLPKQRVFDAKKLMLRSGLVEETKDPKHKQKIILMPTRFGNFIVKFILLIDNFEKAFANFNGKTKEYIKNQIGKPITFKSLDKELNNKNINDAGTEDLNNTIIKVQNVFLNVLINMALYYYELYILTLPISKHSSEYLQKTINIKLQEIINKTITLRKETFGHELVYDVIEKMGAIENKRKVNEYEEDKTEFIQQAFDEKIFSVLSIIRENIENKELITNLNELVYCLIDFTGDPYFYIQKLISIEKGVLISIEAMDSISGEQIKLAREYKDKMLEFYNELLLRAKHRNIHNENNFDGSIYFLSRYST